MGTVSGGMDVNSIACVNLDLRSSQRWLGLAHGLGTWFVVAHGIACD